MTNAFTTTFTTHVREALAYAGLGVGAETLEAEVPGSNLGLGCQSQTYSGRISKHFSVFRNVTEVP